MVKIFVRKVTSAVMHTNGPPTKPPKKRACLRGGLCRIKQQIEYLITAVHFPNVFVTRGNAANGVMPLVQVDAELAKFEPDQGMAVSRQIAPSAFIGAKCWRAGCDSATFASSPSLSASGTSALVDDSEHTNANFLSRNAHLGALVHSAGLARNDKLFVHPLMISTVVGVVATV